MSSVAMLGEADVQPRDRGRLFHAVVDTRGNEDHVADLDLLLGAALVLAVDSVAAGDERPGALRHDPDVDRVLVDLGAVAVRRRVFHVANIDVVEPALEQTDHADLLVGHLREERGELLLRERDRFIERRLVEKEPTVLRERDARRHAERGRSGARDDLSHRLSPVASTGARSKNRLVVWLVVLSRRNRLRPAPPLKLMMRGRRAHGNTYPTRW